MKLYLIAGLLAVLAVPGLSMDATLEDEIPALLKRANYVPGECKEYTVLNKTDRAMGFADRNVVKCDNDKNGFVKKWYRFTGDAGSAMPTKCVPRYHCGAFATGWLSGSHPTKAQGMAYGKVCFNWGDNCCFWSKDIRIRNCGEFYVYELSKTPRCNLRYCGDGSGRVSPKSTPAPPLPQECQVQGYTELKDADRAMGYPRGLAKCDKKGFVKKWYRFTGAAGTAMPTKCVPINHCGTSAPGWLSGSHPTKAQGVVTRKVCFNWSGNCCRWSNNIRVRNCGGFSVYELISAPGCYFRYCGNGGRAP